jgi:hypothetical protein
MIEVLIILFSLISAQIDYTKISSKETVNHTINALIRLIVIGILSLHGDLLTLIYHLSIFWIIFELRLNYLLKVPLLYVGITTFSDKLLRRIFPENTGIYLLIIKLTILCLSQPYLKVLDSLF